MKSFLNSMLPLKEGQYIEEITYQDPGLIPILPELKHSIVDVRCTDNFGRQFIVEMQMYWTSSFRNRMLFNAGKAYVKQIEKGDLYTKLRPVYGLSLIDDIFLKDEEYKDQYYHHYRLAHVDNPEEVIEGIELIFIELPKFKAKSITEKKLQVLWLRFLTEINELTERVPEELMSEEAIREALEHLQVSAFSKEELAYYEKYWDRVRTEKAAIEDAQRQAAAAKAEAEKYRREVEEARRLIEQKRKEAEEARHRAEQERKEKEEARKQADEIKQRLAKTAKIMKSQGIDIETIKQATGLSEEEIKDL
jgi:predicted transposase/invertase (TIGR01784 family)